MRLINPIEVLRRRVITNIANEEDQVQQIGIDLTIDETVIIEPGKYANVQFHEHFDFKDGHYGVAYIRSSLSRKGMFLSCGLYDPGFKGVGGVSLYNMGNEIITVEKGMRICQMVVYQTENYAQEYCGHYNKSNSIESKM